jgi:hypothetical protein
MTQLLRDIEHHIDKFIEMRKRHRVSIEGVLEMVRGNDTPESFVVESDGVPLNSPQPFTFMSRNVEWLEELLETIPVDLETAERVRIALNEERFDDAQKAAPHLRQVLSWDSRSFGEISSEFTKSDDAPLSEKDFMSGRMGLIAIIQTLCSVAAGKPHVRFLGSQFTSTEWVWLREPFQRESPYGYIISFGPETRFLVVGAGKSGLIDIVDQDGQHLRIVEADIDRREAIHVGT